MKKTLKYLGLLILVILGLLLLLALYINASGIPEYPVEKIDYTAKADSASLERGAKLVGTLCAGCHLNQETGALTGGPLLDAPPEFGKIYVPNITQDKTYGIGEWTDGEILYLLRTGIKKDGSYAPPYMAKLPLMADEDINAIIAFLRSDHRLVAPARVPDQTCEPSFLTKMLCRVAFKPFPMPEEKIPMPDTSNSVEWGKYLAFNLECYQCHSQDFKTNNSLNPELSAGYFGGGNLMLTKEGKPIRSSNLTPHKETGIGNMSDEQFLNAVKYGSLLNEPGLQYPMQPYSLMSDSEIRAIHSYLKTIPEIENEVERTIY